MDPRPLPPGFISQYDPNTQRHYYVDTSTGISQWIHPLDVAPPSLPSTQSQFPIQFPSPSPNPNSQGHHPLGFTDPSSFPSSQQPSSSAFPQPSSYPPTEGGPTNPYVMMPQQQSFSSSPYPQPTPFNYPPPYLQSGSTDKPAYPHNPHGEAQSYNAPPRTQDPPGGKRSEMGVGKILLGAGVGGVGGLLVEKLSKKQFKKHKHNKHRHKGWKGKGWKGKGWKGKGWKGKGWKGKGWKGWKG